MFQHPARWVLDLLFSSDLSVWSELVLSPPPSPLPDMRRVLNDQDECEAGSPDLSGSRAETNSCAPVKGNIVSVSRLMLTLTCIFATVTQWEVMHWSPLLKKTRPPPERRRVWQATQMQYVWKPEPRSSGAVGRGLCWFFCAGCGKVFHERNDEGPLLNHQ